MSQTAPAAPPPLPQRLTPHQHRYRMNPLEALERGFVLFRSTFASKGWRYYAGSAPLAIFFISMWVVDGQVRLSNGDVLLEAVLLAAAYLVRVGAVASYMMSIRESAFGVPQAESLGIARRAGAMGRLVSWKIILSLAAIATLPTFAGAPWFYCAGQVADFEAQEDMTGRHSLRGCLVLAGQWYGPGLLLFLMLFPLWITVWLNGLLLAVLLPGLVHSIFGVNTLLSTAMGAYALIGSSAFWLSLLAAAWLALDPIVKCTFVVVYQHLHSGREGDDLHGLLATLPREQKKKLEMVVSTGAKRSAKVAAAVMLVVILLGASRTATARGVEEPPTVSSAETPTDSVQQGRVQRLRLALGEESQRAIYRWHDADHPRPPNWLDKLLAKIGQVIDDVWDAFWSFLHKMWLGLSLGGEKHDRWRLRDLRWWLALVAALTLAIGATLIWRRRRHPSVQLSIPGGIVRMPDLADSATASDHSEDEWFSLANRLEAEGDLRSALRAAYLGLLSGLAQRQWLTIRRDRTNREYLDEFTRRWRRRPQAAAEARAEIPEKLRTSLRLFDRVWYGSYALTQVAVAAYLNDQRELLNHV